MGDGGKDSWFLCNEGMVGFGILGDQGLNTVLSIFSELLKGDATFGKLGAKVKLCLYVMSS